MTSTHDPHGNDATVETHGPGDHRADQAHDDHGHGDDGHGHGDGEALGPVNVLAWGAGAVGIMGGLLVGLLLAVAAGWFG